MKGYFTDMAAFEKRYRSAMMYHRRAEQFMDAQQSHTVVFDVASIAVENYLIAICELYKTEPRTHNYQSLMDTVEQIADITLSAEITRQIRMLDSAYGICSLENYQRKTKFTEAEILQVLHLCRYLSDVLKEKYYFKPQTTTH